MTPIKKNEAAEQLLQMDNLLLLTHKRPDGDTIGSAAALCIALRTLGKTAYLLNNPEVTERYASYFDGLTAPADYEPEHIITVDIAAVSLIPDNALPYLERIDLVLDHHPRNDIPGKAGCIDASLAACGEMIYDIIEMLNVKMTSKIGELLYVAVSTDTGCFLYSNTSSNTHRVAAGCLETGFDFTEINRVLFLVKSQARFEVETFLIQTMRYTCDHKVALCVLTKECIEKTGITQDDLDNIATLPRTIEGVDIGIYLKETDDGVKVSIRTGSSSAPNVASAVGGGGHLRAAGAYYHGKTEDAINLLLDAARKELHYDA